YARFNERDGPTRPSLLYLETKTESSDIFVFARLELLLSGKGVKSIVNCPASGDTYGASSKEGDTR
ncbi:hypothetical protein, partial [Faecalibaculum rodentium]|uniref:hypothetical protein n=1 Tax=Faecalibaculum rodentium TaxID=1702221 RepID=UPI00272AB6C7